MFSRPRSWRELLVDVKRSWASKIAPDLAVGGLGFWKAIEEVFPGTRHHQHAFGGGFHPRLQVNPVRPHIDIAPRREIALLPCLVVRLPLRRQPRDPTAGDRFGASLPRRAERASWKSPVEMPRKYKIGSRASRLFAPPRRSPQNRRSNRHFSASLTLPRSRTFARRTATGPIPVWIPRCGPWP